MKTFMVLVFALLGFAFYEMSGGAEFEPEERVSASVEVAPEAEAEVVASGALTPTETTSIQDRLATALVSPEVTEVVLESTLASVDVPAVEAEVEGAPVEEVVAEPVLEIIPAVVEPEPDDLRQVAGSRVNMRDGPGTNFAVLVTLNGGTATEVLGQDGEWLRIRVRDTGQEGWMAERLLEPING